MLRRVLPWLVPPTAFLVMLFGVAPLVVEHLGGGFEDGPGAPGPRGDAPAPPSFPFVPPPPAVVLPWDTTAGSDEPPSNDDGVVVEPPRDDAPDGPAPQEDRGDGDAREDGGRERDDEEDEDDKEDEEEREGERREGGAKGNGKGKGKGRGGDAGAAAAATALLLAPLAWRGDAGGGEAAREGRKNEAGSRDGT